MFNKIEIITSVKNIAEVTGEDLSKFTVGASGALVMLNKLPVARDIDIEVSKETFEKIKSKFPSNYSPKPLCDGHPLGKGSLELILFGDIEIMVNTSPEKDFERTQTEGVYHRTLESVIKFKKWMNRDKDKLHLKQISK